MSGFIIIIPPAHFDMITQILKFAFKQKPQTEKMKSCCFQGTVLPAHLHSQQCLIELNLMYSKCCLLVKHPEMGLFFLSLECYLWMVIKAIIMFISDLKAFLINNWYALVFSYISIFFAIEWRCTNGSNSEQSCEIKIKTARYVLSLISLIL